MKNDNETDIVRVDYVVSKTGLSRSTVYRLANQGQIPCRRFNHSLRFLKTDIDCYVEGSVITNGAVTPDGDQQKV